jgi:hypothetical protein
MTRVLVLHAGYGCETGCCGHVLEVDDERVGRFQFDHPSGRKDDFRVWAEDLIRTELGEEHVADLDWDHSIVLDD